MGRNFAPPRKGSHHVRPSETAGTRTYPQAGHPCLKKRSQDSQTAFGRPRNCVTIVKSSSFEPGEWVSDFQAPKKYVRDTFLHKMSYSVREGLIFIRGKRCPRLCSPEFFRPDVLLCQRNITRPNPLGSESMHIPSCSCCPFVPARHPRSGPLRKNH